jgi:hypothetical protein
MCNGAGMSGEAGGVMPVRTVGRAVEIVGHRADLRNSPRTGQTALVVPEAS